MCADRPRSHEETVGLAAPRPASRAHLPRTDHPSCLRARRPAARLGDSGADTAAGRRLERSARRGPAPRRGGAALQTDRRVGLQRDSALSSSQALRALAIAGERRGLRMGAQLLGLVELLSGSGLVEALPVKGPVHGGGSLRRRGAAPFRRSRHRGAARRRGGRARGVLLAAGFRADHRRRHRARAPAGVGVRGGRSKNPGRGLVLDLHWRLGPRFARASLPVADLMANARTTRFLGRDVLDAVARGPLRRHVRPRLPQPSLGQPRARRRPGRLGRRGERTSDWLPLLERAASSGACGAAPSAVF
jgi:hypothetical protein